MAGAYVLFGYGLRQLTASAATGLALAEPVVATALATLSLREHLTPWMWVGLSFTVAGIAASAVLSRRPRPPLR